MKLIIGTANFGNLYGLKKKKLKIKEIFKIISLAKKKEFHTTTQQRIIKILNYT